MEYLLLILGAIIGLMLTEVYEKLFKAKKFENRLRSLIKEAKKDELKRELTVRELNKLLDGKTFDREKLKSGDALPFIACPKCGNKNISYTSGEYRDDIYYVASCKKCGWSEWSQ